MPIQPAKNIVTPKVAPAASPPTVGPPAQAPVRTEPNGALTGRAGRKLPGSPSKAGIANIRGATAEIAGFIDHAKRVREGDLLVQPTMLADMKKLQSHLQDLAQQHRDVTPAQIADYVANFTGVDDPKTRSYYVDAMNTTFEEDQAQRVTMKHKNVAEALQYCADQLSEILPDNFQYGDALWVTESVARAVRMSQQWFFKDRIDQTFQYTGRYQAFGHSHLTVSEVQREAASGKYNAFAVNENMVMMPEFFGPTDKFADNRVEVLEMMAAGVHVVALTAAPKVLDDRLMDCGDCAQHDTDHLNLNRANAKRFAGTERVTEGRGFVYTKYRLETSSEADALKLLQQLDKARQKTLKSDADPMVAEAELAVVWSVFHEFGYPINAANLKWAVDELLADLHAFKDELGDRFGEECITAPTDDTGRVWRSWRSQQDVQGEAQRELDKLAAAGRTSYDDPEVQALKTKFVPLRGTDFQPALNRAGVRLQNAQGVYAERAMTLNQLLMIEMAMFKKDVSHESDSPRLAAALEQGLVNLQTTLAKLT